MQRLVVDIQVSQKKRDFLLVVGIGALKRGDCPGKWEVVWGGYPGLMAGWLGARRMGPDGRPQQ